MSDFTVKRLAEEKYKNSVLREKSERNGDELTRLQADNEALRSQVEQLQGRCAELAEAGGMMAAAITTRPDVGYRKDDQMDDAVSAWRASVSGKSSKARDLRLQAEAVEAARDDICDFRGELWNSAEPDELTDYAQRLRDQAEESERGGSDGKR